MRRAVLFLFFGCLYESVCTQCPIVIPVDNSSPYFESFEAGNGGWTTGGFNNDWVLGSPSKAVIKSAGHGNICWVTGGLNGSTYNDAAQGWIQSPCFDFTNLKYPYISFKIFWESETDFDGLQMQYTINNGASWLPMGSTTDLPDCLNKNWYNNDNIQFVRNASGNGVGWSGNVQTTGPSNCRKGRGSAIWLDAGKTMPVLAGLSSVKFRYLFAAGTQCNNFDGAAIDSFTISEAQNPVSFTYQCIDATTLSFQVESCGTSTFQWNFGDPSSGTDNISKAESPIHKFTSPGEYTVTLEALASNDKPAGNYQSIITLAALSIDVVSQNTCAGENAGTLQAVVSPSSLSSNYSFQWLVQPVQNTSAISNLSPGTYSVVATPLNGCQLTASAIIDSLPPIISNTKTGNDTCGGQRGFISHQISGGTEPYSFLWSNGVADLSNLTNLSAGNYSLTVTDKNGCKNSFSNSLISINPLQISLGSDTTLCPGDIISLTPGAGFVSYTWQDGSSVPLFLADKEGEYFVTVTDTLNCVATDSIVIKQDCGSIYFPSAFTPNGDGLNESFGPSGNLSALTNYELHIYDRWGRSVFLSSNPFTKWNGKSTGYSKPAGATTFVWYARYDYKEAKSVLRKGTVTIIL
jgi:gliding motility-associated-like protein